MAKANIGLIGAGMIGDVHIDRIRQDGRGEVTWIAARTEKTLTEKLKKHGIVNGTLDYRDMLADKSVDAVIIASPPSTHYEMLKDALEAGKHVLLEKPMAVNREQMNKVLEIVDNYPDQIVVECSCRHARLQPKFRFVRKMIDDGKLGKVYHIHHNHLMRGTFIEYNPAGSWALKKELAGGGPFFDWGVYDLSFHLGVLGDVPQIQSITSFTRNGLKVFPDPKTESDIEEHGAAYLQFDNELTYYYERGSGVHFEADNETRIFGTKGSIRFSFCSWDPVQLDYFYIDEHGREKKETLEIDMPDHSDDNLELAVHFLDCLLDGAQPKMTVQLAAKHLDILLKILGG